jgi:hypothetical protein
MYARHGPFHFFFEVTAWLLAQRVLCVSLLRAEFFNLDPEQPTVTIPACIQKGAASYAQEVVRGLPFIKLSIKAGNITNYCKN